MERGFEPSQADQAKISQLITSFARSEPNMLKYSEVLMLMLDRCILNNKLTLTHFQQIFEAALKIKPSRPNEKTEIQGERVLSKEQLIYLFYQAAKILFKPDPHFHEKFYNTFLSETADSENGEINRSRVMLFDDSTKKLLVEEAILKLCNFDQEIKHIFICYTQQNYWALRKHHKLLLSLREIMLQNKRWSYISLLLFLKESETTPHLASIEHIQENFRLIVPNVNGKQQEFYSRHVLTEAYHKDGDNHEGASNNGDPGLMLFEFQLLLLKIALDSFPKELDKKDMGAMLQRYMKYLYLRPNSDLQTVALPSVNRKFISKMKDYYIAINTKTVVETQVAQSKTEHRSPLEQMTSEMEKELFSFQNTIQLGQIIRVLDRELPKMPPKPIVVQEAPGPYVKANAITIGQQPPPEPVEPVEKAGKPEKKDKEDEPARVFKWGEIPQARIAAEDCLKDIQSKITFQVTPLGDTSRGTIKKEGYPVIISELLFPHELLKSVVPFIQLAHHAMIQRNFFLALANYQVGITTWKKTNVEFDSAAQIFFQYSKGSVYLSAGRYDLALDKFYNVRKHSDTSKLAFANPDRSLPFYGMGEAFYEMEEYQLAARSFLKARQIRESVLGLEHVQTACVFNNLGCCYYMLSRSHEALGYIEIAEVVIDTQLGATHERTLTVRSNLNKIQHGTFVNNPPYRKFWETFEEDKFEKKKKKKKEEDKKKK